MQTRFKFKEGLMTALGIKNQMVKMSLMLVSGALVWANNGLIEKAKAQSGYWEQAQKQQEEQQRQQQWLNDQEMLRQQNEEYYRQQQEAEARRQQERAEYNRQHPLGEPYVPAPKQKPSSYGAVAWNLKKGSYGSASKQASKQLQTWRCKDVVIQVVRLQHGMQTNVWRLVMVCNLIKNICGNRHLV